MVDHRNLRAKTAENRLIDIRAGVKSAEEAVGEEAEIEGNGRLEVISEGLKAECERLEEVYADLKELADKWEEHGEAADEACARELRDVLEYE